MSTKRKKPKLSAQDYWNTRLVEQEGLSKKVADDLWSTCSEDVRKELLPALREEVAKEVRDELASAVATEAEIAEFKRALPSLEMEALVLERAASNLLVTLQAERRVAGRIAATISCVLVFGFLPALYVAHGLGAAYDSFAFWAAAIPWAVAGIASLVCNASFGPEDERIRIVRKYMTELGSAALRIRTIRNTPGHQTAQEIAQRLDNFRGEISGALQSLGLTADYIEAARRQVRDQQIEQLDTELLCRVDTEAVAPVEIEEDRLDKQGVEALR